MTDSWLLENLHVKSQKNYDNVGFLAPFSIRNECSALTPLSREDANSLNNELEQVRQNVSVQSIFGNNLLICLVMFVPILGPIFGL
jgi:hypothetical protein